ncbi:MAG: lysophospholipid acyltransferase family protein [Burkholderiales bacterium]|nr:lysophospholipid acyltransferase family protein [Burkholderiales bacterium]
MADGVRLRWRRGARRLMFLGVRSLLRAIGFARAGAAGRLAGELQFRLGGRSRRRMQAEMALALGRAADDPAVPAMLREAYRVNTAALFEVMAMLDRRQDEATLLARSEVEGLEHLRAALGDGRGAILLAAHMGNAALLPLRLASAGWPVSVLYKESRMMSADFFHAGLALYGVQGIAANAGIRAYAQMLTALKQGRIVFLMLDQGVKQAKDGLVQRFLGKDMPMPAGPAQLARTARAPVLPVATTAAAPLWRFAVQPALALGRESLEADVASLVGATEAIVRRHPQLWSWQQRRWRKFRPAAS